MEKPAPDGDSGLDTSESKRAATSEGEAARVVESGGVLVEDLVAGEMLFIVTKNREYRLLNLGGGQALLSGHPQFCPLPVAVHVRGCTWGGSILECGFLGVGMRLEFHLTDSDATVRTSPVELIRFASRAEQA